MLWLQIVPLGLVVCMYDNEYKTKQYVNISDKCPFFQSFSSFDRSALAQINHVSYTCNNYKNSTNKFSKNTSVLVSHAEKQNKAKQNTKKRLSGKVLENYISVWKIMGYTTLLLLRESQFFLSFFL